MAALKVEKSPSHPVMHPRLLKEAGLEIEWPESEPELKQQQRRETPIQKHQKVTSQVGDWLVNITALFAPS